MGGQKQRQLESIIELLKKLGSMPASETFQGHGYNKPALFEELTGYDWQWSGESWVRTLEEILAKYKAESERVKAAQAKKRGF